MAPRRYSALLLILATVVLLSCLPADAGADQIQSAFSRQAQMFSAAYTATFAAMGMRLYAAFAVIMIAWAGVQIALSGHFDAAKFARFILVLSIGSAITTNYAGGEWSITDLVTKEADFLERTLSTQSLIDLDTRIAEVQTRLGAQDVPTPVLDLSGALWWNLHWWAVVALQLIADFVISFGYIAQAVCLILGPVFIPFFILPKLDWLFWGWFKAFLQYSFYQVVAAAVVYVVVKCLDEGLAGSHESLLNTQTYFAIVGAFAILQIPRLVSSIFSGSAGSDGGLLSMASSAVRSATSVA